ncbi:site-specific integrase [Mucilaginibacter sp. 3215]|uniref:site-specific integrase n=1 Tax=Mucilaginibacter sp. 3215 TaxID=3373912 RepID=UPI003D1EE2BA
MKEKKSQTILLATFEGIEFNLYIPVIRDKDNKPFVYFNFLNPETNKNKKITKSVGLDRQGDVKTLKKQGKALADDLIDLLSKGWNPVSGTFNDLPITPLSPIVECMTYWLKTRVEDNTLKRIGDTALKNNTFLINYLRKWLTAKNFLYRKANTFTYLDIDNFLQTTAQERGWGKVTYNVYRTDLSTMFKFLVVKKICKENPVTGSEKKNTKNDDSRFVIYKEDELKQVVKLLAADESFKELYIGSKILYYLNIRPIEMTRILVKDIDFEKRILSLDHTRTKNEQDAKWQLNDELFMLLDELVANQPKDYFVFGKHNKPRPTQAHTDFFGQRWRAFRKKYNLSDHLKYYALKHSADWYDLEDGLSLQKISERNRHANPTVTVAYVEQRLNKKIIQPSTSSKF